MPPVWGHRRRVRLSGAMDGPWRPLGVLPGSVWDMRALPGVWGAVLGGWRRGREPGLYQGELGPCRERGFTSGRYLELCRGLRTLSKGMWGPARDLRFVTGSGLFQGTQNVPRTLPGWTRLCRGIWEQFWRLCQRERGALLGVLPGSRLCQKEPGVSTGGLGSCPGSGPCPAWLGVTGSRGLRVGWDALSQSVLAVCAQCEMSERGKKPE